MRKILAYIILTILIASVFFFISMYVLTKESTRKNVKETSFLKKKRLLRRLEKYSWFEKLNKYLKEGDYPYGITAESFVIIHILTTLVMVYLKFVTRSDSGFIVSAAAPLYINLLIYYQIHKRRQKMQLELCNIQDIIYFQDKIGTSQDIILAYAAKAAQEPLKKPLQNFADKYRLKNNLKKSLDEFRNITDLPEFQNFILILEQKEITGSSEENYRIQSSGLKRSKRLRRTIQRSYKRTKLIIAAMLLFFCYMAFAMVPLLNTVFSKYKILFR